MVNPQTTLPRYSLREEIAHSVISAVGVALAVGGSAVLIAHANNYGTARHILSCSVYGATLIFLYTASTLYHSIHFPRAKAILRALDHSAIFLLIAGTYTPFTLVNLRDAGGWSLFGVIWGLAALGIAFQAWLRRWPVARVGLYVGMGWAVVVVVKPMFATVAPGGLLLLLVGGLAYTLGLGFYAWRRLPYHHAIWHVFVLAGSISHFFAILFYVVPTGRYHGRNTPHRRGPVCVVPLANIQTAGTPLPSR
jgi:hemolysin III